MNKPEIVNSTIHGDVTEIARKYLGLYLLEKLKSFSVTSVIPTRKRNKEKSLKWFILPYDYFKRNLRYVAVLYLLVFFSSLFPTHILFFSLSLSLSHRVLSFFIWDGKKKSGRGRRGHV